MFEPSLHQYIARSPLLTRLFTPVAEWYRQAAGYRQVGLRADDLIPEESPQVQKAISRLSPREAYDRAFRLRQAIQLSVLHRELPREKWTKPEEDIPYLSPILEQVRAEEAERSAWDTIKVEKRSIH